MTTVVVPESSFRRLRRAAGPRIAPERGRLRLVLEAELLESQESLQASLADQEAVFRSELAEAADRQAELLRRLEEEKEAVPSEAQDTIVRLRGDLDRSRADAEAHLKWAARFGAGSS